MKRIYSIIGFAFLFFVGLFSELISNPNGQEAGYSGEPGGKTCIACHNSFALNGGPGTPEITTNIPPAGYVPGETYTITARMTDQGINTFGFQATIFGDNSGVGAGTVQLTNTTTTRLMNGPVADYVTHTITGNQGQDSLSWSFEWVAPPVGTQSATIYAAFVSADGQDGNQGDDVYTQTLQVQEASAQTGQLKAFLAGYYDQASGTMSNQLLGAGLLPATQPFNGPPFNYQGSESLQTNRTDLCDWVLLEVRQAQAPQTITARQAVLISQDGQLLSSAGSPSIVFANVPQGMYYLSIRHKSHLGVISSQPVSLNPQVPVSYDYTTSVNQALGNNQLMSLTQAGNVVGLFPGDFDNNGVINNQDFNQWKQNGAVVNTYLPIDADGNGIVNNQDFNKWAANPSKVGNPDL